LRTACKKYSLRSIIFSTGVALFRRGFREKDLDKITLPAENKSGIVAIDGVIPHFASNTTFKNTKLLKVRQLANRAGRNAGHEAQVIVPAWPLERKYSCFRKP
jgi:hypothetical protein